jgi:hypothetical protein
MSDTRTALAGARAQVRLRPLLVALVAFLISFLVQAQIVLAYGVNVPFWDEWEDFPAIQAAYRAGTLTLQQLFAPHNEHRIMTSRLMVVLLFAIRGEWSPLAIMLLSAVVVGCIAAIWAYTVRCLDGPVWVAWLSALLLASPVQHQNITWGFQICFYMLMLAVVLGVCAVVLAPSVTWRVLLVVIAAATWATFSIAAGLLAWAVLGVCLFIKAKQATPSQDVLARDQRPLRKMVVFCLVAAIEGLIYLNGIRLSTMAGTPADKAVRIARWSAMALGYPFVDTLQQPLIVVASALLVLWMPIGLTILVCARRSHDERARRAVVLVVGLMLFVILSSWLIGFGRSGLSLADESRYVTIFIWNSLLALFAFATLWHASASRSGRRLWQRSVLFAALLAALLYVHGARAVDGLRQTALDAGLRRQYKQTLVSYLSDPHPHRQFTGPIPYPWPNKLKQRLDDPRLVAILPPELTHAQGNCCVQTLRLPADLEGCMKDQLRFIAIGRRCAARSQINIKIHIPLTIAAFDRRCMENLQRRDAIAM